MYLFDSSLISEYISLSECKLLVKVRLCNWKWQFGHFVLIVPSPRSSSIRSPFHVFKKSELEFIMRLLVTVFVQRKINISYKPSMMAVTGRALAWGQQYGPCSVRLVQKRLCRLCFHSTNLLVISYANLFVGYIEHQFFNQYNGPKPDLYRRYIDDCVGATSSTREELNQFITAVNSFHPALKYTWEISDTSLAFLDIKVSVEGNGLCTSVHYKPTDSHSYLLYSSSHPSHVKNSIPYSQFLRLRRLCSEDSDFSLKSEEMCEFFDKRGYPASVVEAGHHRAQQIDRQSALQTSQKENSNRIPFTLTFHPHNHAVKSIILKNFKLLQNDPDTGRIFSEPPLISFKRDKNIGNFLVRSAFQTSEQPGTFKCARTRCKTCPFICNVEKLSGPKRSIKITDHFTCTSANVIYCITCTLCKKLYIGETGRRLGDRFREHLRDVEKDDKNASKPVARHFNLPNHSMQHMAVCGLSLHQGNTESRKTLEQKFIFQIGTLNPDGINERFSFN